MAFKSRGCLVVESRERSNEEGFEANATYCDLMVSTDVVISETSWSISAKADMLDMMLVSKKEVNWKDCLPRRSLVIIGSRGRRKSVSEARIKEALVHNVR